MQKISLFNLFLLQIELILEPVTILATPVSDHAHPKKSQKFGRIWENQLAKNQLIPLTHSWDTVNFRLPQADWTYLFLRMPYQKNFYQLSIFANLYQHAKNGAVSSICSGEIVDLKIFQSSWLIAFWPIYTSGTEFPPKWVLCRNAPNSTNFH